MFIDRIYFVCTVPIFRQISRVCISEQIENNEEFSVILGSLQAVKRAQKKTHMTLNVSTLSHATSNYTSGQTAGNGSVSILLNLTRVHFYSFCNTDFSIILYLYLYKTLTFNTYSI